MQRKLSPVVLNPVSLLGVVIAVFALVIILVLLALGATGVLANPYTGILTFMLGPGALALGLIMIPVGALQERHRRARLGIVAKAYPSFDLNDPRQRRGIALFAGITAGIMALMAVTTWGAAEFMESKEFCGDLCHRVMEPEGMAYEASPHARVKCVSCHIGPGAPWLVKAKISGLRQVFNYSLERYPRPIEAPIKDLRPSRDTCEQCHWPDRFYGDQLRTVVHYAQDEKNTPTSQPLVFRVGGSELGYGIHWHTTAKVYYLPLTENRSQIGWVRVEKPDGSVDEYALPDQQAEITPERIQQDERFMDCIDCHNRAAHNFTPLDEDVNTSMARGAISPEIPFIKQQVMKAMGEPRTDMTDAQFEDAIRRIDSIESYYQSQQPQAYQQYGPQIKKAIEEAKNIYRRSVHPDMNVEPGTYPDWVGHDGCMRCHGKLTGISGEAKGKTISASCLTCHYPAPAVPAPPGIVSGGTQPQVAANPILPAAIPHPLQGRETCNACHTVGGPGVGITGGLGLPDNHQGRANDTCVGCHTQAQLATPAQPSAAAAPAASSGTTTAGAAPAPPAAAAPAGPPSIPHPTQGREQCTTCHAPGIPGVGAPGGLGLPTDHQGRTDATCLACHQPK